MLQEIFTEETFRYDTAKIGDLVTYNVVMNAMDALPPACMWSSCMQMGEPHDHRFDEKTGKLRPTYPTFKKVRGLNEKAIYAYCGNCFVGENIERGELPQYEQSFTQG